MVIMVFRKHITRRHDRKTFTNLAQRCHPGIVYHAVDFSVSIGRTQGWPYQNLILIGSRTVARTLNLRGFKNLKIWMKLAIGFGIILVLTTAVGYVGWSGLSGTETIVGKADDANRLIKQALNARLEQKNFMAEKTMRMQRKWPM